jgi:glutamate/tyrosine decarboxylase-like PLP-dependent enzyme
MDDLLRDTAHRATRYLEGLASRGVAPAPAAVARLEELGGPLPDGPTDPAAVVALLDEIAAPATIVNAGGRYFGFVNGGSLPAALAANWLAGAWDQNAGPSVASPMGAALEEISVQWIRDVLGLPATAGGGLVTGGTMANFAGLAAARHALLRRQEWDVERDGMFGAPPLTVVVGNEVHVSVLKALSLLGLGRERVVRVPTDAQGRLRANQLPPPRGRRSSASGGQHVNTGALDPAQRSRSAREAGSWVHVDGAFGLWAAAAPGARVTSAAGLELADSWATDCHKWLNVPYDCGVVLVRDPRDLEPRCRRAPPPTSRRAPSAIPSVHARDVAPGPRGRVWAALRSLGRAGLAELIERTCRHATRGHDGLHHGRLRGPQRRRAEPGPGVVRRRGDDQSRDRRDPGGRHLLVRRHGLAGPRGDADQRLLVGHHRGGRRREPRRDAPRRATDRGAGGPPPAGGRAGNGLSRARRLPISPNRATLTPGRFPDAHAGENAARTGGRRARPGRPPPRRST